MIVQAQGMSRQLVGIAVVAVASAAGCVSSDVAAPEAASSVSFGSPAAARGPLAPSLEIVAALDRVDADLAFYRAIAADSARRQAIGVSITDRDQSTVDDLVEYLTATRAQIAALASGAAGVRVADAIAFDYADPRVNGTSQVNSPWQVNPATRTAYYSTTTSCSAFNNSSATASSYTTYKQVIKRVGYPDVVTVNSNFSAIPQLIYSNASASTQVSGDPQSGSMQTEHACENVGNERLTKTTSHSHPV